MACDSLTYIPSLLPAAFLTQTVTLDDATVKFEIWDTAGQGWIICFLQTFDNGF